jgi:benzodiazapine receptor
MVGRMELVPNALWSPVFFDLHPIGLSPAVIMSRWAVIIATMYCSFRVSTPAAVLLVPDLLCVTLATVLNAFLWWLKR